MADKWIPRPSRASEPVDSEPAPLPLAAPWDPPFPADRGAGRSESGDVRTDESGAPAQILVVDDHDALRRVMGRALASEGYEIVEAADGAAALLELERAPFDVVVSDIAMPTLGGIELLREIRKRDLDVSVVLVTGWATVATAAAAVELGALSYLVKPVELARLREVVGRAVRLGRLARAKRAIMEDARRGGGGPGDRAGLEATFDRTLATLWAAFQPIVRADGTLYGQEALLRSREPELPHPAAVLEAAEELGRLYELGRRMRAFAAAPMIESTASGLLFVNLHPRDLFDPELLAEDAPLAALAHRVVLEITERRSIGNNAEIVPLVRTLRDRGYRIAVDDLGAGYAGLGSLAVLEPEIVKLDMSLVRDIHTNTTKQKLVGSMASLCADLGMLVVAEGVETREELECVLELGCHLVQGYLVARPGPAFPPITWHRTQVGG